MPINDGPDWSDKPQTQKAPTDPNSAMGQLQMLGRLVAPMGGNFTSAAFAPFLASSEARDVMQSLSEPSKAFFAFRTYLGQVSARFSNLPSELFDASGARAELLTVASQIRAHELYSKPMIGADFRDFNNLARYAMERAAFKILNTRKIQPNQLPDLNALKIEVTPTLKGPSSDRYDHHRRIFGDRSPP